jgi:hypothetical protein
MFLMRANLLRVQMGGGWALETETFLGPEMATSTAPPPFLYPNEQYPVQ